MMICFQYHHSLSKLWLEPFLSNLSLTQSVETSSQHLKSFCSKTSPAMRFWNSLPCVEKFHEMIYFTRKWHRVLIYLDEDTGYSSNWKCSKQKQVDLYLSAKISLETFRETNRCEAWSLHGTIHVLIMTPSRRCQSVPFQLRTKRTQKPGNENWSQSIPSIKVGCNEFMHHNAAKKERFKEEASGIR